MPATGVGERRQFRLVFISFPAASVPVSTVIALLLGPAGSLAAVAVEEARRLRGGGC